MAALTTVLYVLVVVVCLALIGLILIQPSKGGGMGAAMGGGMVGESVFGAHAGSHLTKATVVLTTVLFVLTLFLAALVGRGTSQKSSVTDTEETVLETVVPGVGTEVPVAAQVQP